MANYITCKDNRTFAYAETTNKGYYEVVSVSEDGNSCHVKTVWHENKDYIGREYDISVERTTEDFTAVDEMIVVAAIERQSLMLTGWITPSTTNFPNQETILNNLYDCVSTNYNIWSSEIWKNTREFFYIPTEESTDMPRMSIYSNNVEKRNVRDIASAIERAFNSGYDYTESIIVVPDDNFDTIVEGVIQDLPERWRNVVDFPGELKLNLRSIEHKVVVLRHENHFAYMTNVKSDQIIFSSAILFAEQIGKPLNEDAKAALLARNYEAYRAAIYKDVESIINGMCERAKVKMFADFSGNFNGMLINPLRDAVSHARREYDNLCERLNDMFDRLQTANAKLFYAEHGMQDGEDEFITFINDAKENIVSIQANPSNHDIRFCVRTFLTYWDDELWDILRKSDSRFDRLSNWQKLLLDEIFKDRTVKLLIEQKFSFDTRDCCPIGRSDYNANPYGEGTKGMRNPHIAEYDCWGTHRNYIRDALSSADYVQAYSQAVACISGLTLSDSPVMNRFFDYINSSRVLDLPCLYLVETGTYISMKEYKQLIGDKKWEE